jgi:hypothetical protein
MPSSGSSAAYRAGVVAASSSRPTSSQFIRRLCDGSGIVSVARYKLNRGHSARPNSIRWRKSARMRSTPARPTAFRATSTLSLTKLPTPSTMPLQTTTCDHRSFSIPSAPYEVVLCPFKGQ